MKRGKLIVIDGGDGAGKATQTQLLAERLKKEKYKVITVDFPQYHNNFFGKLIGECLTGMHGDFLSVSPYIASVLYAADRFETKELIELYLKRGYIVICDRYVSANQMHQGGKIKDAKKRKRFLAWLDTMEFEVFKIPRPDVIMYLDVPIDISMKLLSKNKKDLTSKKQYSKNKKDQSEQSAVYQERSRKAALKIVEQTNTWYKIPCVKKGELLARESIHELIYATIKEILTT